MEPIEIIETLEQVSNEENRYSNIDYEIPSKLAESLEIPDYILDQLKTWLDSTRIKKEAIGTLSNGINWRFTHQVLDTNTGDFIEISYSVPHKQLINSKECFLQYTGIIGGQFPEVFYNKRYKTVWTDFFFYVTKAFAADYEIKDDPVTYELEMFMRNLCRLPVVKLERFKDKTYGSKAITRNVEAKGVVTYRLKSCDITELFSAWGIKSPPSEISKRMEILGYKTEKNPKTPGKGDDRRNWAIYLPAMEKFNFHEQEDEGGAY